MTLLFKLKGNDDNDHDDDGDHDGAIVVVDDDDDCNDADVIEGGMLLMIYLSIIIFYRNIPFVQLVNIYMYLHLCILMYDVILVVRFVD